MKDTETKDSLTETDKLFTGIIVALAILIVYQLMFTVLVIAKFQDQRRALTIVHESALRR